LKRSTGASPRFDGMLRLRRIYAEAAGRWWPTEWPRDRGSRRVWLDARSLNDTFNHRLNLAW
jgi:hypothetical protein